MIPFKPLLRSMRPHQWAKNALIFGPLLFSQRLTDVPSLWRALAGFGIFCLITGSIYILNDLIDVEQDRLHPQKSHRPIASGAFPEDMARRTWPTLAAVALVLAFLFSTSFALVTATYFVLNLGYCFRLKRLPYLDVLSIAGGFLLRVLGGALVIGVPLSYWLFLCTFLLALYLALGKRRHELSAHKGKSTRKVLELYRQSHLDLALGLVASLTILGYCGYTLDPKTFCKFKTYHLIYTVPFVVFGIVRFLQLIQRGAHMESPTQELLRDIPSIANVILWVVVVIYIIYVQPGGTTLPPCMV